MTEESKGLNKNIGSSFEDYLTQEDNADEVNAIALKRLLGWQLELAIEKDPMSLGQTLATIALML